MSWGSLVSSLGVAGTGDCVTQPKSFPRCPAQGRCVRSGEKWEAGEQLGDTAGGLIYEAVMQAMNTGPQDSCA